MTTAKFANGGNRAPERGGKRAVCCQTVDTGGETRRQHRNPPRHEPVAMLVENSSHHRREEHAVAERPVRNGQTRTRGRHLRTGEDHERCPGRGEFREAAEGDGHFVVRAWTWGKGGLHRRFQFIPSAARDLASICERSISCAIE